MHVSVYYRVWCTMVCTELCTKRCTNGVSHWGGVQEGGEGGCHFGGYPDMVQMVYMVCMSYMVYYPWYSMVWYGMMSTMVSAIGGVMIITPWSGLL